MGRDALMKWAAGYLDGEGGFLFRSSQSPEITCHSVDPRSIHRLYRLFGGTVSGEESRKEGSRPTHRWRIYGDSARAAAGELLATGVLLVKREEATAVRDSHRYPRDSETWRRLREAADARKKDSYYADGTPRR